MYTKKMASRQKGKLLTIVLTLVLMLFVALGERYVVYGISAVVQSYEESIYGHARGDNRIFELARCKIHISIETEPDGTWRNNSRYIGVVSISLVWYNASLFPNGLEVFIQSPSMASVAYVNQTQNVLNRTLSSDWGLRNPVSFDFTFDTCDVKYPVREPISQSMGYFIYNGTRLLGETPELILSGYLDLPSIWITIMPDPQQKLQTEIIETLEKRLDSISNLLNYVIILFVISICTYVATSVYLATRKPKAKTELKPT